MAAWNRHPFLLCTLLAGLFLTACRKPPSEAVLPAPPAARTAPSPEPAPPRDDTPLRSVVLLEDRLIASTRRGLFITRKDERKWNELPTPETLPVGGLFAKQPGHGHRVFYHPYPGSETYPSTVINGLYQSDDLGQSWKLVSRAFPITAAFLHPDGTLYAIATGGTVATAATGGRPPGDQLMMSEDSGQTWKDISPRDSYPNQFTNLMQDPENPELICAAGWSLRDYYYQAADRSYTTWTEMRHGEWLRKIQPFRFEGSDISHSQAATLSNFFDFPFEDHTAITLPKLTVRPASASFGKNDPISIQVGIAFSPENPAMKGMDLQPAPRCWTLRRVLPDGRKETLNLQSPATEALTGSTGGAIPRLLRLDLRQFGDFTLPGTYQIQIVYTKPHLAAPPEPAREVRIGSPILKIDINR
jgi:hypothetical protein